MSRPNESYSANILLQALPDADLALLTPHLNREKLEREQRLVIPGEPITHLYFPEGGVASITTVTAEHGQTETGIFGRDGVSGTAVLLGADRSPHETFMQVDGATALRIETGRLLDAAENSSTLRTTLLRYVQTLMVQSALSTMANAHHRIESRLARWLLMCHDRVDGDEITLTHDFMGMMIAAQRTGVTVTLHILEGAGMIRSKRGRVVILDRDKLEDLAGDAYGQPEAEYRRLIGPLGKGGDGLVPPVPDRHKGDLGYD